MQRRYREKKYYCGEYLEVAIYPVYTQPKKRGKRSKPTSEIQQRLNQRHTGGIELGLQRAGKGIIAAVDDAGVGPGRAHGHIIFLFQQADLQIVPGKLPGRHGTHHTGANNYNIIEHCSIPSQNA